MVLITETGVPKNGGGLITEAVVPKNGGGLNYRHWSSKEWWWFELQTLEFQRMVVVWITETGVSNNGSGLD